MKKIRQIALPLAILFIGAGSAYATSVTSGAKKVDVQGWKIDLANPSSPCVMTEQLCTTVDSGIACRVGDNPLEPELYQTGCQDELFRIP